MRLVEALFPSLFSLGRWGVPLNVLAVLWGTVMTVNLAWPRDATYKPVGAHHWYLKWFALVFLAGALAVGALAYWRQKVENQRVLDDLDPDRERAAAAHRPRPEEHCMALRDRDPAGRARQARPRDVLGRPLPYGSAGVEPVSEEPLPAAETVAAARELVRAGRTFSAHEVLEARWKAGPPEERDLWQGLAQICVGVTHAARGNALGAERLVERGARRLADYGASGGPTYGVDLQEVLGWARSKLATGRTHEHVGSTDSRRECGP